MDILAAVPDYIVPFLIALTPLVFIHEMGHYLIAKRCGVKVEVFSIGFGPELFGWNDRSGTRWKFSLIPLGGYVKMFGDADVTSRPIASGEGTASSSDTPTSGDAPVSGEETGDWADGKTRPLTPEERAVSFHHKRLGQRSWIVAGGPIANFLFAIVLLAGLFMTVGQATTPPVIGKVLEDSAAEAAGLLPGDRIVAINGGDISRFEEIQRIVQIGLSQPLDMVVVRDGAEVELVATPAIIEVEDYLGNMQKIARLGISASGTEFVRHGLIDSLWRAGVETVSITTATLEAVWQMIVGVRGTEELGGPIRIAELSGQVATGGVAYFLQFMAILSINLGLINLFPVPMLDGGHLLFYAIEGTRGRPLGERAQEFGFRIGLALVLTLVVFVTWNDLVRLRFIEFLTGLIT